MNPLALFAGLKARVAPHFVADRAAEPLAATWRARRLQAVLRWTPLAMFANLFSAALLCATLWAAGRQVPLAAWTGAVVVPVIGFGGWRRGARRSVASPRAVGLATLRATLLALLWAVPALALFAGASSSERLLIGIVTIGMMCVGGFILATLPMAAVAWALILGGAMAGAVLHAHVPLGGPIGVLIAAYALIVAAGVLATSRRFGWHLMAEAEAGCQNQVIGPPPRDFEEHASDLRQETDAQGRLVHEGLHANDRPTSLADRQRFHVRLAALLSPVSGVPRPCAVLCLDLDHLKIVNDTLGQGIGDGLLQEIGRRLLAAVRRSDTAARVGGDELVVILHDVEDPREAEQLTQRLLEALQQPCEVQGASISVRVSAGIAMAPRDGTDIDTLLNNADQALCAAKSEARGQVRFFVPEMGAQTPRRLLIEQGLRDALERGQLSLAFQPQVDLRTWTVIGFEALPLWHHPELGDVPPEEFIPVAEEAGLIGEIGDWVLREACRTALRWPAALRVSVDVSAFDAMSPRLAATIEALCGGLGFPPAKLELEINESTFIDESPATMQVLHALRDLGVRIALDDFGTGYPSLAQLRRFPFDTLKMDRTFVRDVITRRDARAIVTTILALARTLRMATVADGVEEPAQVEALRRYGCHAIQGHFVAPSMPPEGVAAFLARWATQARGSSSDPARLEATTMT